MSGNGCFENDRVVLPHRMSFIRHWLSAESLLMFTVHAHEIFVQNALRSIYHRSIHRRYRQINRRVSSPFIISLYSTSVLRLLDHMVPNHD